MTSPFHNLNRRLLGESSATEYRVYRADKGLPWFSMMDILARAHGLGTPEIVAAIQAQAEGEMKLAKAKEVIATSASAARKANAARRGIGGIGAAQKAAALASLRAKRRKPNDDSSDDDNVDDEISIVSSDSEGSDLGGFIVPDDENVDEDGSSDDSSSSKSTGDSADDASDSQPSAGRKRKRRGAVASGRRRAARPRAAAAAVAKPTPAVQKAAGKPVATKGATPAAAPPVQAAALPLPVVPIVPFETMKKLLLPNIKGPQTGFWVPVTTHTGHGAERKKLPDWSLSIIAVINEVNDQQQQSSVAAAGVATVGRAAGTTSLAVYRPDSGRMWLLGALQIIALLNLPTIVRR